MKSARRPQRLPRGRRRDKPPTSRRNATTQHRARGAPLKRTKSATCCAPCRRAPSSRLHSATSPPTPPHRSTHGTDGFTNRGAQGSTVNFGQPITATEAQTGTFTASSRGSRQRALTSRSSLSRPVPRSPRSCCDRTSRQRSRLRSHARQHRNHNMLHRRRRHHRARCARTTRTRTQRHGHHQHHHRHHRHRNSNDKNATNTTTSSRILSRRGRRTMCSRSFFGRVTA